VRRVVCGSQARALRSRAGHLNGPGPWTGGALSGDLSASASE